jgi:uncharacterized NAD(P)/FAD-binding protein YdhS
VGGGASGVLAAIHLLRSRPAAVEVMIIEPRVELGQGVAYGTTDLAHLFNVRAGCLSALSDHPGNFTAWARERAEVDGHSFVPRSWYGEYLRSLLGPVDHVRARAVDIRPWGGRVEIALSNGTRRVADRVVLAPGPQPSRWPRPLGGSGARWIDDPWVAGALTDIPCDNPVLLVGTGLTAIDVTLSLDAAGHRQIVATSRHGMLPAAHTDAPPAPLPLIPPSHRTARSLLAWARSAAVEAGGWAPVVDALRPFTDEIWGSLPLDERAQLLRHVQRRWEVVRHRMAPAVATRITAMRERGQLTIVPGGVRCIRSRSGGIEADLGGRRHRFGAIVNCTGPSADVGRTSHPLVRCLLDRGVARPGPLGLGIDAGRDGCLPGTDGKLWLIGPLRRGRGWETTAIPDIRVQAETLSRSLWRTEAVAGDRL